MCKVAILRGEVMSLPGRSGRSYATFLKLDLTEIYVNMSGFKWLTTRFRGWFCEENNGNLCTLKRR
jgi:hypothetical protein